MEFMKYHSDNKSFDSAIIPARQPVPISGISTNIEINPITINPDNDNNIWGRIRPIFHLIFFIYLSS